MFHNKKFSLVAGVVVSLAMASTAGATVTKTIDFNNQYALGQLPYENSTFATSPWYQVNLNSGAAPVVFTVQDNSNVGHYHVSYENACMSCITSSGRFGLDLKCTGQSSTPMCAEVDTTLQPRFIMPHTGPSSILWSALATNHFTGATTTRAFTVNSVYLKNNQPVIFCANTTTYGMGCTGIITGPGTVNFSVGQVTWMEVHGTTSAAPYQVDNIVVTF